MTSFFEQLKRRNVFRTAATYGALSWVVLQVIDLSSAIFGLPDELMRYLTIVLAIGLVPVVIVSWIYELTPEGIQREEKVPADTPYRRHIAHRVAARTSSFLFRRQEVDIATIGRLRQPETVVS